MDDLRLHAVVARVVAWHNRHPLARRITAAQVNSVGYVALPYTAPGLPSPSPAEPPEPSSAPIATAPAVAPPPPEPSEPPAPMGDIDPVIEAPDDGAIVIDVDPERLAPARDDPAAMTLEVELPEAARAEGTASDLSPGEVMTPDSAPELAPSPPADLAPRADPRPGSALRARLSAREGGADMPAGDPPGVPSPLPVPAPGAPRTMVCSEDFMTPLPSPQVFGWVQTHGVALPFEPADGPIRQVPVDTAVLPVGAGVGQLWVATAAIEIGGRRHRVLLGGGDVPAVLGRRVRSWPRLLGAVVAPGVLVTAGLAWAMWPSAPVAELSAPLAVAEAAPAASAASAASAPAGAASATGVAIAADPAASAAPVEAAASDTSASAPRLPGLLDEAAKAQARATVAALRAQRQGGAASAPRAAAAASAPVPAAVKAAAAPQAAAPAAPLPEVLYGLSTRLLRTRAEAEQLQSAFQALLGGTPGSTVRVEMLPAGEDWRVVCWPYERRADAERARALLQARGLKVELVDF